MIADSINDGLAAPVTILLIEDDLADEMAVIRALTTGALPYQISVARSVTEARQVLATHSFDIILSDYNLPDGTSFDLLEAFADQVVIITTGAGDEVVAAQALHLGIHDYLIKDHQRDFLKLIPHRVEIALQKVRMSRKLRKHEQQLEQLHNLFESTTDLIQSVAPGGHIIYVNDAWREVLGYSEEEVTTLNIFDVIHPDYHEYCRACLQRHLAGEGDGIVETAFQTKDGCIVPVEGNVKVQFENAQPVAVRGIFRNMTEHKRSEATLRELVAHIEQLREDDRKYVAREIHDELGQILAALHLETMMLGQGEGARNTRIEGIRHNMEVLLDKAFQDVHNVAANLRPASLELGVISAIEKLGAEFAKRTGVNCVLHLMENPTDLKEEQKMAIFRIVQESLTNVARHAKASRVEITLKQRERGIVIEVRDNGKGFDTEEITKKKTFGLTGIRERVAALGGSIDITSAHQQGTLICVHLPIILK